MATQHFTVEEVARFLMDILGDFDENVVVDEGDITTNRSEQESESESKKTKRISTSLAHQEGGGVVIVELDRTGEKREAQSLLLLMRLSPLISRKYSRRHYEKKLSQLAFRVRVIDRLAGKYTCWKQSGAAPGSALSLAVCVGLTSRT